MVVLVLLIGGLSVYLYKRHYANHVAASPVSSNPADHIKYAPATAEEKQQSEQKKDDIVKAKSEADKSNSDGKKAVEPVITLANYSNSSATIQAYVPGIYEDGGTCTAVLTQAGQSVTKSAPAFANATTTDCQHFSIPRSEFPAAGTWTVKVSYGSSTAEGSSTQTSSIEVH
jgi:hypothetical protein